MLVGLATAMAVPVGVLGAVYLAEYRGRLAAAARIAGETAPLLLTAYNSNFWLSSPAVRTPFLTYYVFTYSRGDDPAEWRLAWAGALVLVVVGVLGVGVRAVTGRGGRPAAE